MRMNILIAISALFLLNACGQSTAKDIDTGPPYAANGNRIFDLEDIINASDSTLLNDLFLAHERKTSNQMALVTTSDIHTKGAIALFATLYFDSLGLGRQELHNGVGIAFSQELRSCFIATGYGTERVLGDEVVSRIVDSLMVPEFKEERYFKGLLAGSEAVIEFLERPENRMDLQDK